MGAEPAATGTPMGAVSPASAESAPVESPPVGAPPVDAPGVGSGDAGATPHEERPAGPRAVRFDDE